MMERDLASPVHRHDDAEAIAGRHVTHLHHVSWTDAGASLEPIHPPGHVAVDLQMRDQALPARLHTGFRVRAAAPRLPQRNERKGQ